jgi:DNA-binding NarL/FixJ family response regulator
MEPKETSSPLRVLLVEDDEHDRLAFRVAFKKSKVPCEITECTWAEDALLQLLADASLFDLVVIDHKLPGMSGLDLIKELLGQETPLPLVIVTGRGSEQLAVEALKAGVSDYIVKDPGRHYLELLSLVLPQVVRKHGDRLGRERAERALQKAYAELEQRVKERTAELAGTTERLRAELTERKRVEEALRKREMELEAQSHHLKEVNTALRVLLKQREEDKRDLEENVLSNVKQLVSPHLERLKKSRLDTDQKSLVSTMESNLDNIISPFVSKLSSKFLGLTPMQIRVANLIKEGQTNKEIAELLCLSKNTILFHRFKIRSKLGIKNKKINLRTHLLSLAE